MRTSLPSLAALSAVLLLPLSAAGLSTARKSPVAGSRQLVVVTTDGWDALQGTLRRYERRSERSAWRPVGGTVPVVVGRSGLAWGVGRHAPVPGGAPVKREGDGRAPAGSFRLSSAFGYAPAGEVRWIRLPYLHSTEPVKCVDDPKSAYYNQVVDERKVAKDWDSKEDMRRRDHLYRLGVIVDHNWAAQTRPGAGSCIFLHVWQGPETGTAGCTAMEEEKLAEVVRWMDPARDPVLVQLPKAEYARLRREWRLP